MSFESDYPGTGGTCATTLEAGDTCTLELTIPPTEPASGSVESVPMRIHFSDDNGYDISRMSVTWTWMS